MNCMYNVIEDLTGFFRGIKYINKITDNMFVNNFVFGIFANKLKL